MHCLAIRRRMSPSILPAYDIVLAVPSLANTSVQAVLTLPAMIYLLASSRLKTSSHLFPWSHWAQLGLDGSSLCSGSPQRQTRHTPALVCVTPALASTWAV